MSSIIDTLALNYHWGKTEILETVYLDEALEYIKLIQINKIQDNLMSLAIASNPHTKKPKELFNSLSQELRKLTATSMIDTRPDKNMAQKLSKIFNKK